MPGPADYELSPMYQDTLLKGTFNATLNNPLVFKRQKEGLGPISEITELQGKTSKFGVSTMEKAPDLLKVA
jgi:hypothetical protein